MLLEAKVGFTLEFADREDGYKGMQKLYNYKFSNVKTMEPKLRYSAIESGDVNVIDAYSTDSELEQYGLKVLKDDKGLFPPYQGAPLLRKETLQKYPELEKVLNKLSGKITDEEMRKMNYEVNVNGKSSEEVAKQFLQKRSYFVKFTRNIQIYMFEMTVHYKMSGFLCILIHFSKSIPFLLIFF